MPIALQDDARQEAISSLQMYAQENFDEPLGNLAAGSLLDFFLEEVGPSVFNQAVETAQKRLQLRVMEIDVELREPEFEYSRRLGWKRRGH